MLNSRLMGGILLIAGTTIGAAMLALPLATGLGGFFNALILFTFMWLMMLWVGYLMLEVNLAYEGDINFITMVRNTLGKTGAGVMWVVYLMLFYALLAAYIAGSGPIFLDGIEDLVGISMPAATGPFWILLLFCPFLYAGLKAVDLINRVLMVAMGLAFVVMVGLLTGHLEPTLLTYSDSSYTFVALSVVITSFGYHVIIPSLTVYLERDVKAIKKCIMIGSLLPFIIYFIWELVILGTLPIEGAFGIQDILSKGITVSKALNHVLGNPIVAHFVMLFSICAIVTSFLGVAAGLIDFLKDGLNVEDNPNGHLGVFALAFLPPLGFAVFFPQGFMLALEWAGVLVAILLGFFPILMVWSLRYVKKIPTSYQALGNKLGFGLGLGFYGFIVVLVVLRNTGMVG